MKTMKFMAAAFVAAVAAVSPAFAQNPNPFQKYQGVGPVVAASTSTESLPADAREFLNKYFKNVAIRNVEREFDNLNYEVELSDGTDVAFNAKGAVVEIDAPEGYVLGEGILKSILPEKAMKLLEKRKITTDVESVEKINNGFQVDFIGADEPEFIFDGKGNLIAISFSEDFNAF